jgi:hypothetical protein
MSNRRKRGKNEQFMVFMIFARVPEELLGVEVSDHTLWAAKARKFGSWLFGL